MNDDTISRQIAIDALFELYEYQRDIDPTEAADLVRQGIFLAEKKIEQLPSAERRGRWVYDEWIGWCCSECGNQAPFWCISAAQNLTDYCPNCGAKMGEVKE